MRTSHLFCSLHKNVRITLKYEGKLHRIDSPLFDPHVANANPDQVAANQALLGEQNKAAMLMLACMTLELQKEMENHNAYDMINELKSMFQTQGSQELYDTQRRLNACKMEEGQSVSSHVLKIESYVDKLERLGHPMPHVLADNIVLCSLPNLFDNFVMNYNMQGWDNKSLRELHKMFKIAKKNVPSKTVVPSLHMIRDRGVKKKSWKKGKGKSKNRKKFLLSPKKESVAKQADCLIYETRMRSSKRLEKGVMVLHMGNGNQAKVAPVAPILHRSSRLSHPPKRYYGFLIDSEGRNLGDHNEPSTYFKAINGSKSKK
ncbi:hypothetical protein Tco_0902039 [Tanacetum coccineum]